jgi:hypothetical protein
MAVEDIFLANSGAPIKNGTLTVYVNPGATDANDDNVKNAPAISDIEQKYSDRWDDYGSLV